MTQEDKELLTRDLSCRIPYGVIVNVNELLDSKLTSVSWYSEVSVDDSVGLYPISEVKPYLFPLSSMTKEQKKEHFNGTPLEINKDGDIAVKDDFYGNSQYTDLETYLEVIDWLHKNHFDYRGLIEKGLAIDATNLNIY